MTANWGGSGGCRREKETGGRAEDWWWCSLHEEQWASKGKAARERMEGGSKGGSY